MSKAVVHNIVTLFVVNNVDRNIVDNSKLWPFVVRNIVNNTKL